jgi:hypothetical protein
MVLPAFFTIALTFVDESAIVHAIFGHLLPYSIDSYEEGLKCLSKDYCIGNSVVILTAYPDCLCWFKAV